MDNESLLEKFEFVEKQLALDSNQCEQVYWWDLFRYIAFNTYAGRNIEADETKPSVVKIFKAAIGSVADICSIALSRPSIILFATHKRLDLSSQSVDPFTHFLHQDLRRSGLSSAIVYRPGRSLRNPPYGAESLAALSMITQPLAFLGVRLGSPNVGLSQLIDRLNSRLGKSVLEEKAVRRGVAGFKITRGLYRVLFRLIKPEVLVLTVSTGFEAIIDAAKSLGITVFELQHGSPGRGKLNYDYSSGIQKTYIPDQFLATGPGFHCEKYLPSRISQVINFGSPFLHAMDTASQGIDEIYDFTFISQPDVDLELLESVEQYLLSENEAGRAPSIAIRLHPAYGLSDARCSSVFKLLGVVLVNPNDESVYMTIAKSRAVVGAYSTVLFEALYFGKPVYTISKDTNLISRTMIMSGWWMDWLGKEATPAKRNGDYPEFYAYYDSENKLFKQHIELQ
ncbi:alpha-2,8-polysialyltransferase family protein [Luminiphilus sp.]|nr:alpha-2,8-polysialyltransferase family protein [Luminiphilus sp.]